MQKQIQEPSRQAIWEMFNQIAPTYDLANRMMTLGLDQYWRKAMRRYLPQQLGLKLLDCATGTGDQLLALMHRSTPITEAIGIDLAEGMLAIAKRKIEQKKRAFPIHLQVASLLDLPFPHDHFDCITISFGIRNVTDVTQALKECLRVLKPNGRLLILEGTLPSQVGLKQFHLFYLRHLLPKIGGFISKKKSAYRYLNQTIETFPCGNQFLKLILQAGFSEAIAHPLSGGMTTVYQGDKGNG